MTVQQCSCSCI